MDKSQFIVHSTDVQGVMQFSRHSALGQAKERAILEVEVHLHAYTESEISSVTAMLLEQQMCFTAIIVKWTYIVLRS